MTVLNSRSLKVGGRVIDLSTPRVMGILNVTPDSFSDGGSLRSGNESDSFRVSITKAFHQADQMVREGAAIIDVGGESTRPDALLVSEQEELDRVIPVIERICAELDVAVSVDTSTAVVMREAISAGAEFVNDVRALTRPGVLDIVSRSDVAVCLMHMRGEPQDMQIDVIYENVVDEVLAYLRERITVCVQKGIASERLIIDPGFGFGKTVAHNYQLLRDLEALQVFGLPILVGVSRKSMIGKVIERPVGERVAGGIAATIHALNNGASIIRTHDVAATVDAIKIHCAVMRS